MKLNKLKEFKDKKIAILGFGKEGKSTLNFLLNLGFRDITICDKNQAVLEEGKELQLEVGEKYLDNLGKYDLIFKSPGLSPYNSKIAPYINKITSQIQIFCDNYNGKVIGITGTKGKSTTSTLLFLTLQKAGYKVKLVGNIGNPVLEEINLEKDKYDYIVFEMSSYMLEGLKPQLYIGYINNIYNCHLDWHNGKNNYSKAKLNILKYSENKISNIETNNFVSEIEKIKYFGPSTQFVYNEKQFFIGKKNILKDENIALNGAHNRLNISGVITILETISKEQNNIDHLIKSLKSCLETFSGLPHRIENIGTLAGITFIDDAIATTPESTIAAIKTFEHNIGTLMLGGQDSGFKFEKLVDTIINFGIKNIVLFPDTGEKIFGDLSNYSYETNFDIHIQNHKIQVLKTRYMKNAVDFAYKNTQKGKICILSNAAPSFSLWTGYIQKGTEFQNEVKNYNFK